MHGAARRSSGSLVLVALCGSAASPRQLARNARGRGQSDRSAVATPISPSKGAVGVCSDPASTDSSVCVGAAVSSVRLLSLSGSRRPFFPNPDRAYCAIVSVWGQPPRWLEEPVAGVIADLQGALPIAGIVAAVAVDDTLDGVSLAVIEPRRLAGPLPTLPEADELKPEPVEHPGGGGNFVPRGLVGPRLLARVPRSFRRIWPRPKSRGARLGRLAHTIRTPRARWWVTVRRGGSVSD